MTALLAEPKQSSHFYLLRDRIEQEIAKSILGFGDKTELRDACEYALKSGGKRFRPLLVLLIAEALDCGHNVFPVALSVEFFHSASLVADDLPCMDNEDERRSKPCVHKVFGEAVALLSSYALICAAFEKIHQNGEILREAGSPYADRITSVALEQASRSAGILGATTGQFLDISPPTITLDSLKQIIIKKTVTLFEVSFIFGWLFGGGNFESLPRVKKAAYHFGMAFQTGDDIADLIQDEKNQREINMARFLGRDRALSVFDDEMIQLEAELAHLGLNTPSFKRMTDMLKQLVVN